MKFEPPDIDMLAETWGGESEPEHEASILRIQDLPGVGEVHADIKYVSEPLLAEASITAFTGDSSSGKSTIATAIARNAIAAGRPVLFLDRENPRAVVLDRMQRLGLVDSPLLRWWGGWLGDDAPSPNSATVIEWVKATEPKPIIVLDSLAAHLGGDENSAGDMRKFLHGARRLADLGAPGVIIHHDGKSETARDYRGSSDFKASVDQAFHVTNISSDGKLDRLRLRCFKSRFGFSGDLIYRYAGGRMVRDENADAPSRTQGEQLTELLRQNPGIGTKEFENLAGRNGLGRNRARDFLSDGVLAGTVERTSQKNRHQHFLAGGEKDRAT